MTIIRDYIHGTAARINHQNQIIPAGVLYREEKCNCPECGCNKYHDVFMLEDWYKNELKQLIRETLKEVIKSDILNPNIL